MQIMAKRVDVHLTGKLDRQLEEIAKRRTTNRSRTDAVRILINEEHARLEARNERPESREEA